VEKKGPKKEESDNLLPSLGVRGGVVRAVVIGQGKNLKGLRLKLAENFALTLGIIINEGEKIEENPHPGQKKKNVERNN